jgi:polyphosphate kinase
VERFFNRDLSWLKFNERVLAQADEAKTPLLERLRFLAIFTSNLDEFFMKRIGYLRRAASHSIPNVGSDQLPPIQLLQEIRKQISDQVKKRHRIYQGLVSELGQNGVYFVRWTDLTPDEVKGAQKYFHDNVFPILTPLAVDRSHPFPFLSNNSVSLGLTLRKPRKSEGTPGESLFARVKIPDVLPQWVQIGVGTDGSYRLLRLMDLIIHNLSELFPEMEILDILPFRITRDADIELISDDVEDRLDLVEEELRLRRVAEIVRLEYPVTENRAILNVLKEELSLTDDLIYEVPGDLQFLALNEVASLNIPRLRFPTHTPIKPRRLRDESRDLFSVIRDRDLLVHHPYESFSESVEHFIREAVRDPSVLAIKMTLYRAGENNPIIPLLVRAAEKGKQVVAVIELKARFDEARNIYWSEVLEGAGVHVVYGVIGKKIHSKSILVIRKEGSSYRFYSHIGTGNYNPTTAKTYTDLSLFTADRRVGSELIEVFNYLTGLSRKRNYQKLLVAPVNMRKRFLQEIEREAKHAKQGEPAHIIAKMNSLEDAEICDALYRASKEGVRIDLIVRGFCCLKPQVLGLSENIKVVSVVGRFLEHSRVFYFRRGAKEAVDGKVYLGSADWMHRNLNNRVEIVCPVEDLELKREILELLDLTWNDPYSAWDLQPDGEYKRRSGNNDSLGTHQAFVRRYGKT